MDDIKITFESQLEYYLLNHTPLHFHPVYRNIDQATEDEYIEARMDWFGASDSSKLLDVNPFPDSSSSDLIKEKINRTINTEISKKPTVRMGKDVEDIILKKCDEALKYLLQRPDISYYTIAKPKDMYGNDETKLAVNFDAVALIGYTKQRNIKEYYIPFELKTASRFGRKYYDFSKATSQVNGSWDMGSFNNFTKISINENDSLEEKAHALGIPVYYYTQLQQQMMALNTDFGFLGVMDVENWNVHLFYVPADKVCWEMLKYKSKSYKLKVSIGRAIREQTQN